MSILRSNPEYENKEPNLALLFSEEHFVNVSTPVAELKKNSCQFFYYVPSQ